MSVELLQQEFLKLTKAERLFFGRFVVENIFSDIEESVLTAEQQEQVKQQHELYKKGELKVISLNDFKENLKRTNDL